MRQAVGTRGPGPTPGAHPRQTVWVATRVRVREIDDDEGRRLLRIIRRGSSSVATWRRAEMVLLSAQGMAVRKIAEVTFTSADRVRDVIHNFNTDGFDSLYPKYRGGRPKTFTLPERREIKKIAKPKPAEHGLPFSTWSLTKLADFLVAEGAVDDISHEGLRILLREAGVSFQRIKRLLSHTAANGLARLRGCTAYRYGHGPVVLRSPLAGPTAGTVARRRFVPRSHPAGGWM